MAINDSNMAGAPFNRAMDAMSQLKDPDVEFSFFRGTQAELQELMGENEHCKCDSTE